MDLLLADIDRVIKLDDVSYGLLFLRVTVGITFAAHGYFKFFKGGKIAGTARWFDSMGMRPNGTVHAWAAATTELGTGLLFALGLLTPLAAAGMVGVMVVAGYTANREAGFWSANKGWEYNFILCCIAVSVATIGPGKFSLDWVLGIEPAFDPNVGLLVSLGLGVLSGVALIAACYRPPAPDATGDED